MEFQLLHDFLQADTTVKEFAKQRGMKDTRMNRLIFLETKKLIYSDIIDVKEIVGNECTLIYHMRQRRLFWLKAIKAYNDALNDTAQADNKKLSDITVHEFAVLVSGLLKLNRCAQK